MKRGWIFYAALLTLLLFPVTSDAARYRHRTRYLPAPYLSLFLGVSVPRDTNVTGVDFLGLQPLSINETIEFDPSVNVGGTAGFDFGMVRLEGELSYKHAEMSTITTASGTRFVNADGRVGALSMLFNGFFDLHNASAITPYFGGGVGFAAVHLSDTFANAANNPGGGSILLYLADDDTVFAYQVGAGVGIELSPLLTMDIGYRYFGTSKASFTGTATTPEFKLESHNVSVGLRFTF